MAIAAEISLFVREVSRRSGLSEFHSCALEEFRAEKVKKNQSLRELTAFAAVNTTELNNYDEHLSLQYRGCMTKETRKKSRTYIINQAKTTKACVETVTETCYARQTSKEIISHLFN